MRTAHRLRHIEFTEVVVVKLAGIPRFLRRWNHVQTNTTLSVFGKGRSERLTRDQFTSEHFEWIYQEHGLLSRIMLYQRSYQPGLSTLQLDKKHLQRRHRIFSRNREPSRMPARTHNFWATRAEKLENLFLLFTNVSVRVHLSKKLEKLRKAQ